MDHFPSEPTGNSSSKAILYFTIRPEFDGGEVTVVLDGASGEVGGIGIVDDDGLSIVEVPLNAFGAHEVQEALFRLDANMIDIDLLPDGFEVDAAEPVCDPASLVRAASTTTTSAATTTTEVPLAIVTAALSTTTVASSDLPMVGAVGSIPWAWIGLGAGLPLLVFGLWLLIGPGRDCARLRREREALGRQYDQIREALDEAIAYLEERRAATTRREAEIAAIERAGGRGGSLAGRALFKLIPERPVTEEGHDAALLAVHKQLDGARDGDLMAEESVEEWRRQLTAAAARAEAAGRAYEDCVGKTVAGSAPPTAGPCS